MGSSLGSSQDLACRSLPRSYLAQTSLPLSEPRMRKPCPPELRGMRAAAPFGIPFVSRHYLGAHCKAHRDPDTVALCDPVVPVVPT